MDVATPDTSPAGRVKQTADHPSSTESVRTGVARAALRGNTTGHIQDADRLPVMSADPIPDVSSNTHCVHGDVVLYCLNAEAHTCHRTRTGAPLCMGPHSCNTVRDSNPLLHSKERVGLS